MLEIKFRFLQLNRFKVQLFTPGWSVDHCSLLPSILSVFPNSSPVAYSSLTRRTRLNFLLENASQRYQLRLQPEVFDPEARAISTKTMCFLKKEEGKGEFKLPRHHQAKCYFTSSTDFRTKKSYLHPI